jgi:hypothetical protein
MRPITGSRAWCWFVVNHFIGGWNMRTAIYVYQPTLINIMTCESDLQLSGMEVGTMPLSKGNNEQAIAPGVYKIDSSYEVVISGDTSAFDLVTASGKDNDPTPPLRATTSLASLDIAALQSFLTEPNAKLLVNP